MLEFYAISVHLYGCRYWTISSQKKNKHEVTEGWRGYNRIETMEKYTYNPFQGEPDDIFYGKDSVTNLILTGLVESKSERGKQHIIY